MALDFKEKLGPLPVWAWGVIGGGVIIGAYYLMNRGGTTDTTSTVTNLDSSGYQTAGISGGSASGDDSSQTTYDTNALWLSRASQQTAAMLGKPVTDVYNALKKFLNGDALTDTEKSYVDNATKNTGTPPEGTEGISTVTPTPTPGKTTPKRYPTSNTQWYVTTSNSAGKYLWNSATGKLGAVVDPVTWAGLRAIYGNNIDVRIVTAAQLDKMKGKK